MANAMFLQARFPVAVVFLASLTMSCSSSTPEAADGGTVDDSGSATPTPTGTASTPVPTDGSVPDAAVVVGDAKLSAIQSSILTPSCATSRCHAGAQPAGALNLESGKAYAQLVGVASSQNAGQTRVVAGDPTKSLLSLSLKARVGRVGRMPDAKPMLPASQIATVDAWIAAGAKND